MYLVWIIFSIAIGLLSILLVLFFCLCYLDQKNEDQKNEEIESASLKTQPEQKITTKLIKPITPLKVMLAPNNEAIIIFSPKKVPQATFMRECREALKSCSPQLKMIAEPSHEEITLEEYDKLLSVLFEQEHRPTLTDYRITLFRESSPLQLEEIYATVRKMSDQTSIWHKKISKKPHYTIQRYQNINIAMLYKLIQRYIELQNQDS